MMMKMNKLNTVFVTIGLLLGVSASAWAETAHGSHTTQFGRTFSGAATADADAGSVSATGSAGGKWGNGGVSGTASGQQGEGGQATVKTNRGYGGSGSVKKSDGSVQAGMNTNGGGAGQFNGGKTDTGYSGGGSWTTRNGKTATSNTTVDTTAGTVNRNTLSGKTTSRQYDTQNASARKSSLQSRFSGRFNR